MKSKVLCSLPTTARRCCLCEKKFTVIQLLWIVVDCETQITVNITMGSVYDPLKLENRILNVSLWKFRCFCEQYLVLMEMDGSSGYLKLTLEEKCTSKVVGWVYYCL
jgi:hypothetical protein